MKKTAAFLLAAIIMAGASVIAMAAEDFAPGENPNLQGARGIIPESYTPTPDAPVLSVEDYQDLNDAMGEITENGRRIPAYGSAGVTAYTEVVVEEDNVAAATTPETPVPVAEPRVAGTADQPNPNTGAVDMLAPVMTAILSLAAAPIVARVKK